VSAKAYGRGVRALSELGFRRKGLAVSLVVIFALIVGLVFKIRQLERRTDVRSRAGEAPHD
jgi:HAMP domain-containing protein